MSDIAFISENGPVENLQVVVLILAALLFLKRTVDLSKCNHRALSSYSLAAAVLPLLGAARELSFGRVIGMEAGVVITLKLLIGIIAVGMAMVALMIFVRSAENYIKTFREFILHRASISIYLGLLLIGIASVFEKGYWGLPKSEAAEEILELIAFCFILRAAMILKPVKLETIVPLPVGNPAPALAGMTTPQNVQVVESGPAVCAPVTAMRS